MQVLIAQETRFKDTYTIPIGQWLLISSGVLNTTTTNNNTNNTDTNNNNNKQSTGVAIYLNPKVKGAAINYVTVSDRILTKAGPLAIVIHHAPDETKDSDTKTAHWDLVTLYVIYSPTPLNLS